MMYINQDRILVVFRNTAEGTFLQESTNRSKWKCFQVPLTLLIRQRSKQMECQTFIKVFLCSTNRPQNEKTLFFTWLILFHHFKGKKRENYAFNTIEHKGVNNKTLYIHAMFFFSLFLWKISYENTTTFNWLLRITINTYH